MCNKFDERSSRHAMPAYIAWLSVCLLCAGWGRHMPATLQRTWVPVGMFGLAASVGLNAVGHLRRRREEEKLREINLRRLDAEILRIEACVRKITSSEQCTAVAGVEMVSVGTNSQIARSSRNGTMRIMTG